MTDDNIILNSVDDVCLWLSSHCVTTIPNAELIYAGSISKSVDENGTTISGINAE